MIDRGHELPLGRQAELLGLSRSTLYYEPRAVPATELAIMRRIDELHLDYPFAGSRMLRDLLRGEGVVIGRELVTTLMRRMGIEAIYRKPNTSKAALGHKIHSWRLRGLELERPNQANSFVGCRQRQRAAHPAEPGALCQDRRPMQQDVVDREGAAAGRHPRAGRKRSGLCLIA
jgi:HTH-like domain